MWAYVVRRLLANIPVYLGILLFVMLALRVHDPVYNYFGKRTDAAGLQALRHEFGLDRSFLVQYADFIKSVVTLDFRHMNSWEHPGKSVQELLLSSVGPSLALAIPTLVLTSVISIAIALLSAYFRGRTLDRSLMLIAVMGMSISFLVYIILGQRFGAYGLKQWLGYEVFAISGYKPGLANWFHYCALPVAIAVLVGIGYDTRFYRAVMVEESNKDYITTARAKGAPKTKIMFVHMLKNAMIQVITRLVVSLPFLVTGSILEEKYFNIPGMGLTLLQAISAKNFPVIQAFTAILAALYIAAVILTDVMYALVDPRVRLE